MGANPLGRVWRRVSVAIIGLLLAGIHPGRTVAQSGPMRWDGILEHVSLSAGWWGNLTGPMRMSRHAVSNDGRWVIFGAEIPNGPSPSAPFIFRRDRLTGTTEMVIGAPASQAPVISADGNHVAFQTCEAWMRPDNAAICDIQVVDLLAWRLVNASTALDETLSTDASDDAMLSATGRFLVFRTTSPTLLPQGAAPGQIVLRDRDADGNGTYDEAGGVSLEVVSVSDGGVPGNGPSESAEVSADGRFIAFRSLASDLVPGDTNNAWDVFVHDRQTGQTRRINVGWDGQQATPMLDSPAISMTESGDLIAFAADDDYLTNPPTHQTDTNNGLDVIVYDANTGSLTRVDIGDGGAQGNGHTYWPSFSADGRYLSMLSTSTNLGSGVTPGRAHAYVYDRVTNQTARVSMTPNGTEPNADVSTPVISGDGSYVVFLSAATNLAATATAGTDQIFGAAHFAVSPTTLSIDGKGGAATLTVTAQQYVEWTGQLSDYSWLNLDTPLWGRGNATITVRAPQNWDPTPRTVTMTVNSVAVTITQGPGLSMSAITPSSAPDTGGAQVTITGTGFEPGITLFFDGIATPTEFVNSTTLRAITPAHAAGLFYVWLSTADFRFAVLYEPFRFRDTSPPQITPYLSGLLSASGWYTSDVAIDWWMWDPDSQLQSSAGCSHVDVRVDTAGLTYTCTATSEGGTASASVTVRRDTTPPVITVQSPVATIYTPTPVRSASYSCTDAVSGVASCSGGVGSGQPLDMTPGFHSFPVVATDAAGNARYVQMDYAIQTGVCAPRPAGLAAWWPFETSVGQTTTANYKDTVSGLDATPVNTQFRFGQGAVGYFAMSTASLPSYVNAGTRSALAMSDTFTLSAWIYPTVDYDPSGGVIAGREGEYLLARFPDGTLRWSVANASPGWTWVNTERVIPKFNWSHVVLTYDGSRIRTYVNGRAVHDVPGTGPIVDVAPTLNEFRIGARQQPATPSYFVGGIDDLHLLTRALAIDEVERIFLAGNTGLCGPRSLGLTISPSPVHVAYGTTAQVELVARLTDSAAPVQGRTVRLIKSGQTLTTGVTDANGEVRATTSVTGVFVGTSNSVFEADHVGDLYYASAHNWAALVTDKAVPQITWPAPAPIVYGTALGAAQLNATANTSGTFTYAPVAGTVLPAGTQTLNTTFQPAIPATYTSASSSVTLEVTRATPSIQVAGGTFTYDGTPHGTTASATGALGQALTPLTITYNGLAQVPVDAGTYNVVASYAGDANHAPASASATLTVVKAAPVVSVVGGTYTYDATAHAATASATGVGGALLAPVAVTYNGDAAAPVNAGAYAVVASFAGSSNYEAASGTATLTIEKATPTVSAVGGTFTYDGSAHSATASAAGIGGENLTPVVVTYNGGSAAPVNAGTYDVTATVEASANYSAASAAATLMIDKAAPAVSVTGGTFTYDATPHAAVASATGVGGEVLALVTVTYDGSSTVPVNAGTYAVLASFAGNANYTAASGTATLDITRAAPTVGVTGGTFTYDATPHAAVASATGVGGEVLAPVTVTYDGSSTVPVNAGTYAVTASFAGNINYPAATAVATLTIGKAAPALQWNAPAAMVYGTPLGAQLNASANVPGTFSYAPAAGTVLPAGAAHALYAVFTPADPNNYSSGSIGTIVAVVPAPLTIQANAASKPFGAPLPALTASAAGFVNGDSWAVVTGTLTLATPATAQSAVGAYPIVPSGVAASNYAITFVNGTLSIVRGSAAVGVSTMPEPSGMNQPMTFTATVAAIAPAAGAPGGNVRFYDGAILLGTTIVSGGTAVLTTAGLDPGVRSIQAQYDGDGSFEPGTATASHVVRDASGTPSLTITSSRNPATNGQSVTLTANVSMSSGPVSGLIQFYSGATLLGSGTIAAGHATFTTTSLSQGSHAITALYTGSAGAPPSRSGVFVQSVGPSTWKNKSTSMTLTSSLNPSGLGASVVFTARVTGSISSMPTGRILIMIDGAVAGDPAGIVVSPVSGTTAQVTLTLSSLAGGRHRVTATYLGDPNYKGSTALLTQQVN